MLYHGLFASAVPDFRGLSLSMSVLGPDMPSSGEPRGAAFKGGSD